MSKNLNIAKNYLAGRLRFCEFSITNACIAKCSFCEIWKQQPKVFVDREKALAAIDILAGFGVGHLTLTGGEPLLHHDVIDFVKRATERNVNTAVLNAAPKLLMRNDMLKKLADSGCDLVSISFDSGDPDTISKSRQIPNIMQDMEQALDGAKKEGVKTMASVLIWNDNYDKLEDVCRRAKDTGFDFVSLNYPTFSESKVYPLGGEGISLSRDKVIAGLKDAVKLKKSGKWGIVNQVVSMENIIRYLEDPQTVRFMCKGGNRVLFVDWFFDVRPCMQLPDVLGSIFDLKEGDLCRSDCNDCNMSWYRDFSTYFFGLRSVPVLADALSGSIDILRKKKSKKKLTTNNTNGSF